MAGYSGTPLVKKLGIKPGQRVALINAPEGYTNLLSEMPEDVLLTDLVTDRNAPTGPFDLIQYFATEREALESSFRVLKAMLAMDGMLWISWLKGMSGIS